MPVDCVYVSQTRIQAFVMAMLSAVSNSFNVTLSTPQITTPDYTKDSFYEKNTHLNCLKFFPHILFNPYPCFKILPQLGGAHLMEK